MNKLLIFGTIFLFSTNLFSQINIKDSTVQVIGYWSKYDTQSYNVTYGKYKVENNDTISRELIKYEVDVKIIDSTSNSYTIDWFYKNYSIDTNNELVKKLSSIADDISVKIKTDEFGSFMEVVNWKDIKDYLSIVSKKLEKELKDIPNHEQIIANAIKIYSSKQSIEANAIKDALQFYKFHGVKYKLGDQLTGKLETSNNYGGKPFETDVIYSLDEINETEGNSVLRSNEVINSKELTDATYDYLKKSGKFGKNFPTRDKFPSLKNETNTASRVHGNTGWIIYSIETKEVTAEGTSNIEERIIEIK